jgi:hypothetical protein
LESEVAAAFPRSKASGEVINEKMPANSTAAAILTTIGLPAIRLQSFSMSLRITGMFSVMARHVCHGIFRKRAIGASALVIHTDRVWPVSL